MKTYTLIFTSLIFLFSCGDKDATTEPLPVTEDNSIPDVELLYDQPAMPILFEYTSTGCPGCGSWGKPTFYSIAKANPNDVLPLAVHIKYGDPMITPVSEAIAANRYGSIYTPQIWVNDTNGVILSGGYIDGQGSIQYINAMIANAQANTLFFIDGSVLKKGPDNIHIKTGVKESPGISDGTYYLSCYLLNDSLIHQQTSYASNPASHNFVIRQAADGSAWGQPVAISGGKFEYTFEFRNVDATQINYFVSVLWKKEGTRYVPVGGFRFE